MRVLVLSGPGPLGWLQACCSEQSSLVKQAERPYFWH